MKKIYYKPETECAIVNSILALCETSFEDNGGGGKPGTGGSPSGPPGGAPRRPF